MLKNQYTEIFFLNHFPNKVLCNFILHLCHSLMRWHIYCALRSRRFAQNCVKCEHTKHMFPVNIKVVNTRPHEKFVVTKARTEHTQFLTCKGSWMSVKQVDYWVVIYLFISNWFWYLPSTKWITRKLYMIDCKQWIFVS